MECEFELSLFSSEVGEFSLYLATGKGDLEGLGDLGAKRDWDLITWLRGDPWSEEEPLREFSASKEWFISIAVLVDGS